MGVSNFRDELEEVWVPKDVGELEGLLLTIQNEPGKKILKHKIQQALKEKRHNNYWDDGGKETRDGWVNHVDHADSGGWNVNWYNSTD